MTLEYQDKAGFPPEVIYGPGSTFDYINEVYLKLDTQINYCKKH